jgi:hypothetical protein
MVTGPVVPLSQVSQIPTGSRSIRTRTIPPVTRTATGAVRPTFDSGVAPQELKPKSKAGAWIGLLVVLGAAGAGWKMFGQKLVGPRPVTIASDPNRRFYVHVKSVPEGADIYLGDGLRSMGSTPVTLPIDLTGLSSVKLRLKKPGYEDYEQLVTGDQQLSISLMPIGGPPPGAAGTGGAPASGEEIKKPRHRRAPKPATDESEKTEKTEKPATPDDAAPAVEPTE